MSSQNKKNYPTFEPYFAYLILLWALCNFKKILLNLAWDTCACLVTACLQWWLSGNLSTMCTRGTIILLSGQIMYHEQYAGVPSLFTCTHLLSYTLHIEAVYMCCHNALLIICANTLSASGYKIHSCFLSHSQAPSPLSLTVLNMGEI